jgi:hypothetical protein
MRLLARWFKLLLLMVLPCLVSPAGLFLFDRPICTGLGDRVGTMLSLAALARVENATIAYLWCEDPSVVYPRVGKWIPRWTGWEYNLTEFRARFRPPPEIVFVQDLADPSLQRLPKVVWGESMPFPAEQGSDSIPQIGWLTMRLPTLTKLDYINQFQAHYRNIIAPIAAAQPDVHGPFILVHLRGPDDNTPLFDMDTPDHYCTGRVVRALLRRKLGMPVYAISNNLTWANEMLEGRVPILEDAGSAYDHFSLLVAAKAIIQHAWGGWSAYSSVAALISGAPMISTYDPAAPHHRFRLFKSQLAIPPNFYDCTQIPDFTQAILSRAERQLPHLVQDMNPATLLYTPEGHLHKVHPSLNDRGLAPLTRWVQAFIHSHQFVQDCSARRFTVFHGFDSTFGSEMHVIGAVLGYAIEHNTTLLLGPNGCSFFASPDLCNTGCECVLAPISNCKYQEAPRHATRVVNNAGHQFNHVIPSAVKAELLAHRPRMTDRQVLYWWRAQSSAFVTRFNRRTIQEVSALRMKVHPYRLPSGVINVHMRRGDKNNEMRLPPTRDFVEAANELAARMPNSLGERTLLVTSDDTLSGQEARRLGEAIGFNVILPMQGAVPGGHTGAAWMQLKDRQTPFYIHLLKLTLALEADAWIGTRGSNWNRLIDELRCVWVDKCLLPYVEVGDEPLGSYGW